MGRFTGVLLVSDYDNTLVDSEGARHHDGRPPQVSERNREALEFFMGQGGRFALATGRALPALEGFVDQIPMNAPSVVCNGAALYDFSAQQYLDHIPLDGAVAGCCQEALERYLAVRRPITGRDADALFLSSQNERVSRSTVHAMVKKRLGAAGLDHCFRISGPVGGGFLCATL